MKKVLCMTIMIIIAALTFCSCDTGKGKVKPTRVEVSDFDIRTAKQMLENGDKIIVDLSIKDTVSRQEYNQFLSSINEVYGEEGGGQMDYMFFYNEEFENEQVGRSGIRKS